MAHAVGCCGIFMDTQVLIVGAGPTGLTLANELARQHIPFRIIDKMIAPTTLSKAIALQARTLELLERFPGVVEKLLQQGLKLNGGKIFSQGQALTQVDIRPLKSRYPFVLSLPQYDTENVLRDNLVALGYQVELQTELLSIEINQDQSILALIRYPDGREEKIQVAYLAACDGARSTLRKQLNLPFKGSTFNDSYFMLADVTLNKPMASDHVEVFLENGAIVACFPLSNTRFRFIVEQPKSTKTTALNVTDLQKLLQAMIAPDLEIRESFWFSEFNVNQRKVMHYQMGHLFFLGDAAHIHSPIGGQGMNTGMQDAINLGWKLSAVLKSWAKETLLNTYDEERNRVGEKLLRATDIATRMVMLKNSFAITLRNFFIKHLTRLSKIQQLIINNLAELSINYRKSFLSKENFPATHAFHAGDRWPYTARLSCDVFNLIVVNGSAECYQRLSENLLPFQSQLQCFQAESSALEKLIPITLGKEIMTSTKTAEIYLIRPDFYVGYCASPLDIEGLVNYLTGIIRSA